MTAAHKIQGRQGDPGNQRPMVPVHGSSADPAAVRDWPTRPLTAAKQIGPTPSIADFYADLLLPLNDRQRKGLIARLSVGYFEGWRPTRPEMAQLVAQELRRGHPRR